MQSESYEVLEIERKVFPLAYQSALEEFVGLFLAIIVYILQSCSVDLFTEELHAEGVYRADEVTGMLSTDEMVDTVTHLLSCLVGEGQTQDVAGIDAEYVDQIGIPIGKPTRLAGSCASDDPYFSFGSLDSLQLFIIQSSQFHIFYPIGYKFTKS
jgi:hypothetical protein